MTELSSLPNHRLVKRLRRLVDHGNALTAELLAHMGEVDGRRLYLEAACPSMFVYCTDILRMSEAQTYRRIGAARLARKFPSVLPMVHSGQLHLCALALLAPHMTEDNGEELLQQAVHLTKRQVEKLAARRFPSPPVPDSVRKLPKPKPKPKRGGGKNGAADTPVAEPLLQRVSTLLPVEPRPEPSSPAVPPRQPTPAAQADGAEKDAGPQRFCPASSDEHGDTASTGAMPSHGRSEASGAKTSRRSSGRMTPLSADAYKIQFTAGHPLHHKLRQAQELLRHQVPDGDLATVLEKALDALLPQLLKERFAQVSSPRKSSRGRKSSTPRKSSRTPSQAEAPKEGNARNASREESTRDKTGSGIKTSRPSGSGASKEESTRDRIDSGIATRQSSGGEVTAKRSRHIPAEVKRQVAERDGYQCTYTDPTGRRCPERGLVEFHHVQPFGKDGEHEVTNVRLLCKAHNAGAARRDYGDQIMERWHGQGADKRSSPTVPGNSWQSSRTTVKDGATTMKGGATIHGDVEDIG